MPFDYVYIAEFDFIFCKANGLAGEIKWILQYMYYGYFCVDSYSPALLWSH